MTQDSSADHADLCHYFSDEGRTFKAVPFRGGFRVLWHPPTMPATVIGHRGHATIRDFWEHYTEFADIYDRFALSSVSAVDELHRLFGFSGTRVINLASGTGRDTLEIARHARQVVGIEPASEMRAYALDRLREAGVGNVEIRDGVAEDLPAFVDGEFDRALSIHGAPFPWDAGAAAVREAMRVVRPGGFVAFVGTTPGWRMDHQPPGTDEGYPMAFEDVLRDSRFETRDVLVEIDYGTVAEALATWGCIYGEQAIDYLLDRQTSVLSWSLRIWHREM